MGEARLWWCQKVKIIVVVVMAASVPVSYPPFPKLVPVFHAAGYSRVVVHDPDKITKHSKLNDACLLFFVYSHIAPLPRCEFHPCTEHALLLDTGAYAFPEKGKKWLPQVDVFNKRFLFFPIHEADHWSVCFVRVRRRPSPPSFLTKFFLLGKRAGLLDADAEGEIPELAKTEELPPLLEFFFVNSKPGYHSPAKIEARLRQFLHDRWAADQDPWTNAFPTFVVPCPK